MGWLVLYYVYFGYTFRVFREGGLRLGVTGTYAAADTRERGIDDEAEEEEEEEEAAWEGSMTTDGPCEIWNECPPRAVEVKKSI